ncbi:MAG: hypothetical protein EP344_19210 [Bacteroidetes bacterium]|nr:MAG: hypothetical protein EP344_19210 [Bacteroidota bacterium]
MQKETTFWLYSGIALSGFAVFASVFQRTDGVWMYLTYALLFALGIVLTRFAVNNGLHWSYLLAVGLLFRGVCFLAPPHLSDDYFRFTWDGELQKDGISSFAFMPMHYDRYFAGDTAQLKKYEALYGAHSEAFPTGMNSGTYYSIYPTVNQTIFKISGLLGSPNEENLLVMRIFLLLGELASFFVLLRLLRWQEAAPGLVGLYWFNPLCIIETVGNLHFDGLATTFVLLTLFFLHRTAYVRAGIALALAVCTKLNPLFLIGALFRKVPARVFLLVGTVTFLTSLLLLSFVLDATTLSNFKESFGLYFAWFEFNAGPYYLAREAGRLVTGADISPILSNVFPVVTVLLFGIVLWNSRTMLAERFLLLFFIYFSFSPIVHPWYIVVLVPLAVVSRKLYPLLWSLLVFGTYTTYRAPHGEMLWFVFLEYGLVYLLLYLETGRSLPRVAQLKKWCFPAPA